MTNQSTILHFQENVFIPFEEHWGWIDFLIFAFQSQDRESSHILRALLAHKNYQHDYLSPYRDGADGQIHGPFRLEELQPSDFTCVEWEDFQHAIVRWIAHPHYSRPSREHLVVFHNIIATIDRTTCLIYKLTKSREKAEHQFGWILTPFEEFVVIDFQTSRAIVAVFGDD